MCAGNRVEEVANDVVDGLNTVGGDVVYRTLQDLKSLLRLSPGTTDRQLRKALQWLRTTKPHATISVREIPDEGTQVSLYEHVPVAV